LVLFGGMLQFGGQVGQFVGRQVGRGTFDSVGI